VTQARLNGLFAPDFAFEGRLSGPVGAPAEGMVTRPREIDIADARELQGREGVSEAEFFRRHGFVLLPHVTAVRDWDRDFEAHYRGEIDAVIRERLFPGRRVEIQQGPDVLRRGRGTNTPDYANGVHSDGGLGLDEYVHNIGAFANAQAANWWRKMYERPEVEGFVWLDFWRTTNMAGPLEHMPLALCEPASVEIADTVPIGLTGIAPEGRESHHLSLRYNPGQRWYYYPRMTGDELLAFKLAEFWKGRRAVGNCFHSAFEHPDTPTGAEARQSCEHRVGVIVLADA
jgi:hypothetical protein